MYHNHMNENIGPKGKLNQQPQIFLQNNAESHFGRDGGLLVIPILLDKLNCTNRYNQL